MKPIAGNVPYIMRVRGKLGGVMKGRCDKKDSTRTSCGTRWGIAKKRPGLVGFFEELIAKKKIDIKEK